KSPHASCTVLVRKPDGAWRCCIDFRRLSAVASATSPPARVGDLLQKLSPEKVFTGVDMWKGYWQVPLHEDDVEKTAFNTPFGLYEWLFMPMGLPTQELLIRP
ncbi:unnamed protein product, partial [Heterosigma akashiwo]